MPYLILSVVLDFVLYGLFISYSGWVMSQYVSSTMIDSFTY